MAGLSTTATGQADLPDLNRVTFFAGQRLAAEDLNQAATVQRELRWLHNRSLHSWGIGLGFAVKGNQGDRQISIEPGYAIDCQGREIILTATLTQSVPARADDGQGNPVIYFLVAAYPDDSKLVALEQRKGDCDTEGSVRLRDRAEVYWKAQGEQLVEQGIEIVLAQATVQNCQLSKPLSLEQRRSARPSQQPFIAAGQSDAGNTPWEEWTMPGPNGDQIIGVRAVVDTSAARFGATPEYEAQLRGERLLFDSTPSNTPIFVIDGMAFLTEPSRNSFMLSVFMSRGMSSLLGNVPINPDVLMNDKEKLLKLVKDNWFVVWTGVEG